MIRVRGPLVAIGIARSRVIRTIALRKCESRPQREYRSDAYTRWRPMQSGGWASCLEPLSEKHSVLGLVGQHYGGVLVS
jgi:hypothetical protein